MVRLNRAVVGVGFLGLLIMVLGCRSPDFDAMEVDRAQWWAYNSFQRDAMRMVHGQAYRGEGYLNGCSSVRVQKLPGYHPSKFIKTLIRACDKLDQIDEKYEHPLAVLPRNFLDWNDDLFTEAWANEIGSVIESLEQELVCGEGKESFYKGNHKFICRRVDSTPVLVSSFDEAVVIVVQYLEDSARVVETMCAQIASCKQGDNDRHVAEAAMVRAAISSGEWENPMPMYLGRGEWEVFLRFHMENKSQYHIERFRVLNEMGTWRSQGVVSDAGYPLVVHCGSISEFEGERNYLSRNTLRTITMAQDVPFTWASTPCRWGY